MIEMIVLNYLNEVLDVPAYMEIPGNQPETFVLIEKTGEAQENFINSAMIVIQSYAENLYDAAVLNEKVKQALDDIIVLDVISKSKLNSDYNYTDTTKKLYRYQAVYDLVYFD